MSTYIATSNSSAIELTNTTPIWQPAIKVKETFLTGENNLTIINPMHNGIDNFKIFGNSIQETFLPDEYQWVEYIEGKRGPYINTGIIPNNNTCIDLTFRSINYSQSQYILGVRDSAINYAMNGSSSRTDWDIRFNGNTIYSNIQRTNDKMQSIISMEDGDGVWILNNLNTGTSNSFNITNQKVSATLPLGLFCYMANDPSQTNTYTHYDLMVYSCGIYENGTLVKAFIPCYRKSDKVAGMYDLVNNEFYTNQGNGEFIAGPEIPCQNTPIEIESVGLESDDGTRYNIPIEISTNLFKIIDVEQGTAYDANGALAESTTRVRTSLFSLKAGTYTFKIHWDTHKCLVKGLHIYDNETEKWEKYVSFGAQLITFTLSKTSKIRIIFQKSSDTEITPDNILASYPTLQHRDTLEDDCESNINIYLTEPLRKIGDYVDYIDYKNKTVIRSVGCQIFDGTEEWGLHTTLDNGAVFRNEGLLTPLVGAPISATLMSHFSLTNVGSTSDWKTNQYRFTYSNGNIAGSRLYISAEQTNVEDFKNWLANNKPYIIYPLATSKEESVEFSNDLDWTHGSCIWDVTYSLIKPSKIEINYWEKL